MTRQGQESEGFKAPGFTRQHFQLIAEVLADATYDWEDGEWEFAPKAMAELFADRLASTNPQFNRDRFIDVATGKREQ